MLDNNEKANTTSPSEHDSKKQLETLRLFIDLNKTSKRVIEGTSDLQSEDIEQSRIN